MQPIDEVELELRDNLIAADEAWLGLGDTSKLEIHNPMVARKEFDIEHPDLFVLRLMRNPDYFSFTCKHLLGIQLLPFQLMVLKELWTHSVSMVIASRGGSKSFTLAIYAMLRMILMPGTKIVLVGAGFRQSKIIFEYMEGFWNNSPILRDIAGNEGNQGPRRDTDRWTLRVGTSTTIAIPMGDGEKIRGLRAHVVISDEFNSINADVFETVVLGFGAVSNNPVGNVKEAARRKYLKKKNVTEATSRKEKTNNQSIISGTCGYSFEHFAKYFETYRKIIKSRGNLEDLDEKTKLNDKLDPKDYFVVRLPFELIPEDYMDEKTIARAKATIHSDNYQMEYSTCFAKDSKGFFKRSLIQQCCTSETAPVILPISGPVVFEPMLRGNPTKRYIYGIDPASENDNFAIVILEQNADHHKVVYVWTSNKKKFQARKVNVKHDFYAHTVRKIRDLMRLFPCERIVMDGQGGGVAVEEALHDADKLETGEQCIWRVPDEDDPLPSDQYDGLHILQVVQFANAEFTQYANHGLKKDLEERTLLFPEFNTVSFALALEADKAAKESGESMSDAMEECMIEIEQLKDEITTIQHTKTAAGRDRWDTPEIKESGGKKGRLRKDRYSALVMANAIARQLQRLISPIKVRHDPVGGFAHDIAATDKPRSQPGDSIYAGGPKWLVEGSKGINFGIVQR